MPKKKIVKICSGVSPLGPSKKVKAAVRKAIKGISESPEESSSKLQRLLSSRFKIREANLMFGNSFLELLYLITDVLKPGRVVIAAPAIETYEMASALSGASVINVPASEYRGFSPDLKGLLSELDGGGVCFLANPNRLTGRLASRADLMSFFNLASEQGVIVVLDENLIEFAQDTGFLAEAARVDNVIVLRSTALYYGMPGLELSYAISSDEMIERLVKRAHWTVNHLALEAACAALKDKAYVCRIGEFISGEKRLFMRALNKKGGIRCLESDSNVFLISFAEEPKEIIDCLSMSGFELRECVVQGDAGGSYLAVSVMGHADNSRLIRLVKDQLGRSCCTGPDAEANRIVLPKG